MYLVKLTGTLRVSEEGELEGLDIHEARRPRLPHGVRHGHQLHHHRRYGRSAGRGSGAKEKVET